MNESKVNAGTVIADESGLNPSNIELPEGKRISSGIYNLISPSQLVIAQGFAYKLYKLFISTFFSIDKISLVLARKHKHSYEDYQLLQLNYIYLY